MELKSVKTLDKGPLLLHILQLPQFQLEDQFVEPLEVFAVPIFTRKNGLLLALPMNSIPEEIMLSGVDPSGDQLLGPCTVVSVSLAAEEEDGTEVTLDMETEVILADFHMSILPRLRQFDPVTEGQDVLKFFGEDIDVIPLASSLLEAATHWVEGAAADRLTFYSADEGPPLPAPAHPRAVQGKAKAKASSRKVTTATLSEQLSSLAQAIPAISSQLTDMQSRQDKMEALLTSPGLAARRMPQRMDFDKPPMTPKAMGSMQFMNAVGLPPRVRASPGPQQHGGFPEDEPNVPLEEEPELQPDTADPIVQSLFIQQKALTSLVAHLTQDGLADLGGSGASSSSLSLKGSAKREKLMADLSSRKGSFLLKVAQNAYRRLKPTEVLPPDLPSFQGKAVFTKYLERQGGFGGAQRDLGLVMWLLANVADQMVAGDQKGAQEMLALTLVALEQVAQDGGKWEVGWLLSLSKRTLPLECLRRGLKQQTLACERSHRCACPNGPPPRWLLSKKPTQSAQGDRKPCQGKSNQAEVRKTRRTRLGRRRIQDTPKSPKRRRHEL